MATAILETCPTFLNYLYYVNSVQRNLRVFTQYEMQIGMLPSRRSFRSVPVLKVRAKNYQAQRVLHGIHTTNEI